MSSKQYLRNKYCSCCKDRLEKIPKREIQEVSSYALLKKINDARNTILYDKNKSIDEYVVQSGDLVCKNCINKSNKFHEKPTNRKRQRLSVHHLYRDYTYEASTSHLDSSQYTE